MSRYPIRGSLAGGIRLGVQLFAALLLVFYLGILTNLQFSIARTRLVMENAQQEMDWPIAPHSLSKTNPMATSPENHKMKIQASLSILSCFVAPDCFPRYKCRFGRSLKIKRKARWEEMPFCLEDLRHSQLARNKRCLAYSFGIHTSMEWETKVATFLQCEVHAFDPTVEHDNSSLVTFHKLGLQGKGTDMSLTNGAEYSPNDPKLMLSLPDIMERLGHSGRMLDVLMLDCEGCEWGVLHQLACQSDSHLVDQLVVEFHFQKSLGLANDADVIMAAEAITCLRLHGWGKVAQEGSGCGGSDVNYTQGIVEILPRDHFLMYAALQRVPPGTAPMPSDVFDPPSAAAWNLSRTTRWKDKKEFIMKTTRFKPRNGDPPSLYSLFSEPPGNLGDMLSKQSALSKSNSQSQK